MRLLTAGSLVRVKQGEPKNCPIRSLVGQFLFNNNRIWKIQESVSYTHLDVYKRQGENAAAHAEAARGQRACKMQTEHLVHTLQHAGADDRCV